MSYINFEFNNLIHDKDEIMGTFISTDFHVRCEFRYNIDTEKLDIWDNNKDIEEILPIPINWLLYKIENGEVLKEREARTCY